MRKNKIRASRALLLLVVILPLCGCGSINIFPFPYQSAAKAADKVLDDILPASATGNASTSGANGSTATGESPRQLSEAKKP
ncbi:MAG: hypothetical protein ABI905_07960 [Betaproteobacteria bacterium]